MKKGDNGIPPDVALRLKREFLTPLANSANEKEFRERKQALLESDECKSHPKFTQYMLQTWLPEETCQVNFHVPFCISLITNQTKNLLNLVVILMLCQSKSVEIVLFSSLNSILNSVDGKVNE